MDRSVRTWNPYVTTKATSVMKGHTSAVVHVVVNTQHGQIISVGKDKVSTCVRDEPRTFCRDVRVQI